MAASAAEDTGGVRACYAFSPALSGGAEDRAHENLLFYLSAVPDAAADRSTQANRAGLGAAVAYLAEQFAVSGATREEVLCDDSVLCLHSPVAELWVALEVGSRLAAESSALHLMLERSCGVFAMQYGRAALVALTRTDCDPRVRDVFKAFYARVLDFFVCCVFPPLTTSSWEAKRSHFRYPCPSWYAVAAFDALVGYACTRLGGLNDTPRLALRCATLVHRHLAQHLGWPTDSARTHYALFEVQQLRVLASSLPHAVLSLLKLRLLTDLSVGGHGPATSRAVLHLPLGAGDALRVCVVLSQVSDAAVLLLLREAPAAAGATAEEEGPTEEERQRGLLCAAGITAELREILRQAGPLDDLRALPLRPAAGAARALAQPATHTGSETFWLLSDDEGLQGCALTELHMTTAREVARWLRAVVATEDGASGEDDSAHDSDGNAAPNTRTEACPALEVCRAVGDAGLLCVTKRRGDGAVLAVLVRDVPRLPARYAVLAAVKATLGF